MTRASRRRSWFSSFFSVARLLGAGERPARGNQKRSTQLRLEALEDRTVPTATLTGVPTVAALGPGPITNASNVDLDGNGNPNGMPIRTGDAGDIQNGAIEAVAVDPANAAHVAIGAANGGVWVTGNINASPVAWTTNTDQLPSLAISDVAFSPTNGNTIYAGTGSYTNGAVGFQAGVTNPSSVTSAGSGGAAAGIYRSTDNGLTWTVVGANTFAGMRILRVVPTTLNGGQTVFAATTDTNGANTGGIYRSDNSGLPNPNGTDSWVRLSGGANGLPNQGVTELIADPNNTNRFFAAVANGAGAGVYRLDVTGGNTTWTNISNNLPAGALSGQRIRLAISTAATQPIWAGVVNTTGFLQGVYRGIQGAGGVVTWTAVGPAGGQPPDIYGLFPNPQGSTNFSLVADPNAANFVYVGGDAKTPFPFTGNLARGDSTLNTWTAISKLGTASGAAGVALPAAGANPATGGPHSDSRDMVFDGATILEVDDGGIYRLTNPTAAAAAPVWSSLHGNLQVGEVYQTAVDTQNTAATADDVYVDAQQDDGANERSTAGAWQEISGGDGTNALADSVNGHRYFASQNFFLLRRDGAATPVIPPGTITNPGAIAGLKLNTANTTAGTTQVEALPFFTSAALNANNLNQVLVGGNTTLYRSTDNANTFFSIGGLNGAGTAALGVAGLTGTVTAIAFGNTANVNLAYVADANGNLLMTTNITAGGGGFVATNFNAVAGGAAALGIVIDPNTANTAYAVTNTGVFQTTNGTTWVSITDNILGVARPGGRNTLASIALFNNGTVTAADDVILVGGLGGVFRRPLNTTGLPPGQTWSQYGAALPNVLVPSLQYDPPSDTLLVGTYGRSVWTFSSVSTTVAATAVLNITADNTVDLRIDPSNPLLLDVFENKGMVTGTATPPDAVFPRAAIQQISVTTTGNNAELFVDFGNGNFIPTGGITYNGGAGTGNKLALLGQPATPPFVNETETPTSATAGTIQFDSNPLISYSNISAVADTVGISGTAIYNGRGINETIDLVDGGTVASSHAIQIDSGSSPVFATVDLANKPTVTVKDSGVDTIKVATPTMSAGLITLNVDTTSGSGGDTFNVQATAVTTKLLGGGASDTFVVSSDAGINNPPAGNLAGIAGTLSVVGGTGSGNRLIVSDFGGTKPNHTVQLTRNTITAFAPTIINYSTTAGGSFTDGTSGDGILLRDSNTASDVFDVLSTSASSTTTIQGNGGNDTALLDYLSNGNQPLGGALTFNGGPGTDIIQATADTNFVLANALLSVAGLDSVALANVEAANLSGGGGNNTFTVDGWTGGGVLDGKGGSNTLRVNKNANLILTDTVVLASDGLGMNLHSIQVGFLTSLVGNHTLLVAAWTGQAFLTGQGGSNAYVVVFNGSGSGTSVIHDAGLAGAAQLTVYGTAGPDLFTITPTFMTRGNEAITYDDVPALTVHGQGGNDFFVVNTTLAPASYNYYLTYPFHAFLDGLPSLGNALSVIDTTFGAIVHNIPLSLNAGAIEVGYFPGPRSYVEYQGMAAVATYPDAAHSYAQDLYHAVLHRNGAPSEIEPLAAYVSATGDRAGAASYVVHLTEARFGVVRDWFITFLGRVPVNGEDGPYVAALLAGYSEEVVLSSLLATDLVPTAPDSTFVYYLYAVLLRRAPSPTEFLVATQTLIPQNGRGGLAFIILNSAESRLDAALIDPNNIVHFSVPVPSFLHFRQSLEQLARQQDAEVLALINSGLDRTSLAIAFLARPAFDRSLF